MVAELVLLGPLFLMGAIMWAVTRDYDVRSMEGRLTPVWFNWVAGASWFVFLVAILAVGFNNPASFSGKMGVYWAVGSGLLLVSAMMLLVCVTLHRFDDK